jgi:uncharacterized protein YkwD
MLSTLVFAIVASNAQVAYVKPAAQSQQVQMLSDLNASRRRAGLRPLALDTRLNAAAYEHAADMAQHNYFDHTSPDGRSPFQRMHADGCRFSYAGENIAMSGSEPEAYNALYHSPEHRDNILNAHYTHVGIGIAAAPDGTLMYVQDFSD